MKTKMLALAICFSAAACGAQEAAFEPTEHVVASNEGQPAAAYEVKTQSDRLAEVHVWSEGAYREGGQTIAHVALELRNVGQEPIHLSRDLVRLEAFGKSGAPLPSPTLTRIAPDAPGQQAVPPAATATIHLYFALPGNVNPRELGALRLRWGLALPDGRRYVQFTEFERAPEPRYAEAGVVYYSPIFGFYDPFLYGPPAVYYRFHVPVGRAIIDHRTHIAPRP